jgi:hypothetical protein
VPYVLASGDRVFIIFAPSMTYIDGYNQSFGGRVWVASDAAGRNRVRTELLSARIVLDSESRAAFEKPAAEAEGRDIVHVAAEMDYPTALHSFVLYGRFILPTGEMSYWEGTWLHPRDLDPGLHFASVSALGDSWGLHADRTPAQE